MSELNAVNAVQIVSVPLAGVLCGMIGCMSFAGIPAIAMAPSDLAPKQWKKVYDLGSTRMPPLAISTALCFGFLAYKTRRVPGLFPQLSFDPTSPSVLYGTAAILVPLIVPFTITQMAPTNDLIMARAKSSTQKAAGVVEDNLVQALLEKWSKLNYIRASIVGTAAILAATATVMTH